MGTGSGMRSSHVLSASFRHLGACLFLCASLVVAAEPGSEITITESDTRESVHIEMTLTPCATQIRFTEHIPTGRRAAWHPEGSWRWVNDSEAKSEHCASSFAFSTSSIENGGDREYPFILRSDAGTHLYLPYLKTEGNDSAQARATFISEHCITPISRPLSGYLLVDACLQDGRRVHVDSSTPTWLAALLETHLTSTLAQAQTLFGPIDDSAVRMYVRFSPSKEAPSWRGWTSGAELFVNFSGDWTETAELRYHAEKYLTHEVLHLWNGWLRSSGNQTPAWLSEGYAEFFALELMRARGSITGLQLQDELIERSMQCMNVAHAPDTTQLAELKIDGQSIYDCGVMAIYQLDRRLASASLTEAAAPWRRMFSDLSAGEITLEEVLSHYAAYARAIHPLDPRDISKIFSAPLFSRIGLEAMGIESTIDTSSDRYKTNVREQFFQSLVQQFCNSPPFGFTTYSDYVELDTDVRCDVLSGNPKISGVAGSSVFKDDVVKAVRSAVNACNMGEEFQLNVREGRDLLVRCKTDMSLASPRLALSCRANAACDIVVRNADE